MEEATDALVVLSDLVVSSVFEESAVDVAESCGVTRAIEAVGHMLVDAVRWPVILSADHAAALGKRASTSAAVAQTNAAKKKKEAARQAREAARKAGVDGAEQARRAASAGDAKYFAELNKPFKISLRSRRMVCRRRLRLSICGAVEAQLQRTSALARVRPSYLPPPTHLHCDRKRRRSPACRLSSARPRPSARHRSPAHHHLPARHLPTAHCLHC